MNQVLKVHPQDNVIVALRDFEPGDELTFAGKHFQLLEDIPVKHKFAERDFAEGDTIIMYGVTVGKAKRPIPRGSRISTENVSHASSEYSVGERKTDWQTPDISRFEGRTFQGFHRADGKVGTRNYWLVIPLVFCENRNIKVIQDSMLEQLGYATERDFTVDVPALIQRYRRGATPAELLDMPIIRDSASITKNRLFPNVDGIRFLLHDGGCGGIRQDSETLVRLLAGYITHPNVAGATVLSLGCQNAQFRLLEEALQDMDRQLQQAALHPGTAKE